jgi:hypothetical protein
MNAHVKNLPAAPNKPAALPDGGLKYVLIVPVWGSHHTGLFLRFCIPFLLTDGNVGAFPNRRLRVCVLSTRTDFARMRGDANYRHLATLVDLAETEIDGVIDLSVPHRAMTECYLHAVRALEDPDDTVTIFPTPDCILSRNALSEIRSRMEAGWRGVMICGLRATLESTGPLLDDILAKPDGPQGLDERTLTALVLKNLHPITLTCDVTAKEFMSQWPSHVYWIAPDRSWLVAHCFHLHPLAVRGVPANIDINSTIDGDYLLSLGITVDELYVCQDSNEFFCVELSPFEKRIATNLGRFSERALIRFSVSCNAMHRLFYSYAIRWRGLSDVEIPDAITSEIAKLNAAVARGSKYEELRAAAIAWIRREPLLFIIARALVRSARWVLFLRRRS